MKSKYILNISKQVKKYSQGLMVGCCSVSTMMTLGYIWEDNTNVEKKRIIKEYEEKIKLLKD